MESGNYKEIHSYKLINSSQRLKCNDMHCIYCLIKINNPKQNTRKSKLKYKLPTEKTSQNNTYIQQNRLYWKIISYQDSRRETKNPSWYHFSVTSTKYDLHTKQNLVHITLIISTFIDLLLYIWLYDDLVRWSWLSDSIFYCNTLYYQLKSIMKVSWVRDQYDSNLLHDYNVISSYISYTIVVLLFIILLLFYYFIYFIYLIII